MLISTPNIALRYAISINCCLLLASLPTFTVAGAPKGEVALHEYGHPPMRTFDAGDLGNARDINYFAWDRDGYIYAASREGVLMFDGFRWSTVDTEVGPIDVVATSADGRVYFAGGGGIGYFEATESSGRTITLLSKGNLSIEGNIHSIVSFRKETYFVSQNRVFKFSADSQELETINGEDGFETAPVVFGGKVYVVGKNAGLWSIDGSRLLKKLSLEELTDGEVVSSATVGNDGRLYLLVHSGAVWAFNGNDSNKIAEIEAPENEGLTEFQQLDDGSFLVVSGMRVHVYDGAFDLVREIGKSVSQFSVRIDGVGVSRLTGELWISTGENILSLDLASNVSRYASDFGVPVNVSSSVRHQGEIYLQSSEGIFKGIYNDRRLAGFERVFRDLSKEARVLGASSEGLLIRVGDNLKVMGPAVGGPYEGPYQIFDYDESIVSSFKRDDGKWQLAESFDVGSAVHSIIESDNGVIWLEMGDSGTASFDSRGGGSTLRRYGVKEGLSEGSVYLCELGDEIRFIEEGRMLKWDGSTDRFEHDQEYDFIFEASNDPLELWQDGSGRIWAVSETGVGIVRTANNSSYLDTYPIKRYGIGEARFVAKEDNGTSWIASNKGLVSVGPFLSGAEDLTARLAVSDVESFGKGIVRVSLAFPRSEATGIELEYRIGEGGKWAPVPSDGIVEVFGIGEGSNRFEARAILPGGALVSEVSTVLDLDESVGSTGWTLAIYVLIAGLVVSVFAYIRSANLRSRNLVLEKQVQEKDERLMRKSSEHETTVQELREMHSKLVESARMAGMAEVANGVLHNVGNVMNSIAISINTVSQGMNSSKLQGLGKALELLERNRENLADFLTNDPRGEKLVAYLENLYQMLLQEREKSMQELELVKEHAGHATKIIAGQQRHAKKSDHADRFTLSDLVKSATDIGVPSRWKKNIDVNVDVPEHIQLEMDQHMLLQMVTNFIKNASESIMDAGVNEGLINIQSHLDPDSGTAVLTVKDNGGGLDHDELQKVFSMGFTTKSYGHGFGLHGAANEAKAIGGSMRIDSEGRGKGATVSLEIPLSLVKEQP